MRYAFKAKKGPDEVVEGVIEAPSQEGAVAKVIEQGLVPVAVEEEGAYTAEASPRRGFSLTALFGGRVTKDHIYIFTKQLRVLLKSQVPILNGLNILQAQTVHAGLRQLIGEISEAVREGGNFSDTLERFPQHFSPLYVNIIRAGEATGKLDFSLEQIMVYLDREKQLSQKVKASLAYPLLMLIIGMATVIFLMTFVVPKLSALFEDFADELPIVTKILLFIAGFFSKYWIVLFAALAGLIILLIYNKDAPWQKKMLNGIRQRLPLISSIVYNQTLSNFARGLSILLASGVSVLEAISITIPLIDDEESRMQLEAAHKQISAGTGLEESFSNNCTFLPEMFIKMVAIGEASGRLDEVLAELAGSYTDDIDAQTKIVASLVEPLAILFVGGILSLIIIAVLLPIFDISFFVG